MSQLARKVLLDFPASLTVTTFSNTRLDLAWSAILGAASYRLYRNGVLTDSLTELTASATGLVGSTQYLFQVSCIDAEGLEGPKCPTAPGTTFATPDLTAPTTPVISAGSATLTSVVITLVAPAIDTGSGIASYTLQRASNSAFTVGLVTTTGLTTFPLTVPSLQAGTQYWFRLWAIDTAGNVGASSLTVNITTLAGQTAGPFWPNWPWMNWCCVQGAGPGALDASMAADKDAIIVTSSFPTPQAMQNSCDAIDNIWAQQDRSKIQTKIFQYLTPAVTYKVLPNPLTNERAFNLQLILDPVNGSPLASGSPRWKVHRVGQPDDAGLCETLFAPTTDHQVNITAGAGLNAFSEDYATAYWAKYDNAWTAAYKNRLSGVFHDVFNQVPAALKQNSGALDVSDPDYDLDGIADSRDDFSTNPGNGGRQWALGGLNTKAKFEARNSGKYMAVNAARVDSETPPMPVTSWPFFRKLEFPLDESVHANLSLTPTGSGWMVAGTPGATGRLQAFYQAYYRIESCMRLESDIGSLVKGAYLFHSSCNDRTPTSDDLEAMRFMSIAALMVERGAPCMSAGTGRLFSLDETLLELGNPISARSMGTFDLATGVLTLRAPDQTVGAAKFFWAVFAKGIAIIRGDTPATGVYPSADLAAICTLPTPPAGKKWQRINCTTYVNPVTDRAMRNQSPAINSGADAASVSLKPFHAIALRLV